MRFGTPALVEALKKPFDFRWVADVSYAGTRVIQDAPVTNVRTTDNASSQVQGIASLTLVWQDDFGKSIAPLKATDLLSPFGTEVTLSVIVTVGEGFTERVPMGVYILTETPKAVATAYSFQGGIVSKGDSVDLTLKDKFHRVQRDRFDAPGVAPDLSSVWREVQRLTEMPVTRTVTDLPITAAVAYEDSKLDAVYDLATILDATACMTADGTVSMRPVEWPAPVDTIRDGDDGTLVSLSRSLESATVYNRVAIRTNGGDGKAVLAVAEVTDGPFRVRNPDGTPSPYGVVTYFYSSDYITTTSQAQSYADVLLPRVSKMRSVSVEVTEIFNPLRDLGDVVNIVRRGETFAARVTDLSRSDARTQQVSLVTRT